MLSPSTVPATRITPIHNPGHMKAATRQTKQPQRRHYAEPLGDAHVQIIFEPMILEDDVRPRQGTPEYQEKQDNKRNVKA